MENKPYEISPDCFEFELWEGGAWTVFGAPNIFIDSLPEVEAIIRASTIGFCESDRLKIRPRGKDDMAVMFHYENRDFWFHMPKYIFERIYARK